MHSCRHLWFGGREVIRFGQVVAEIEELDFSGSVRANQFEVILNQDAVHLPAEVDSFTRALHLTPSLVE